MQVPKELWDKFGKKIPLYHNEIYREKEWGNLKLRGEEVLYVKRMYHDFQRSKLIEFIEILRTKNTFSDDMIHLIDERPHLTPYILIFNPNNTKAFWSVLFQIYQFNITVHRVIDNAGSKKRPFGESTRDARVINTEPWSGGYCGFSASEAVDSLIFHMKYYPIN